MRYYFKKHLNIALISVMISLIGTSSYSQSGPCNLNGDNAPCTWGPWSSGLSMWVIYAVGPCPACSIKVDYDYRICNSGGQQYEQYQMTSFVVDPTICSCAAAYINGLSPSAWASYMNTLWLDLNRAMNDKVFIDSRNGSTNQSAFDCDQSPPSCNSTGWGNNHHMLAVYSACVEYITLEPDQGPAPSCVGVTLIVQCSTEGCCMLDRQYCWDNGLPRVCETWTRLSGSSGADCEGNAIYSAPSGCRILQRSGCVPTLCNE